ncbi:MAG TPA: VOC family protein [Candidatus Limnocylindria bacterium]|nr:VOC family protein [Candidatus Limnocylindria bacterium]
MRDIVPFLWFADGNAEEAVRYYVSVFPNSRVRSIRHYPDERLSEHFRGMQGKVLTAEFELNGRRFMALDGEAIFRLSEAFSLLIECDSQEEIDYYWDRLSHVPESEACGWCKDRFGVSWQIVPRGMDAYMDSDAAVAAVMDMKKIDVKALDDAAGR